MKRIFSIKILLAVILLNGILFSQKTELKRYMVIRSTPRYTLQINLHYNQSVLELSGTYNDDVRSKYIITGETFGADKGFGGSVLSKIALDERGAFRFTQELCYNRILSYTFGNKATLADQGRANYNAITGALGIEYNFTPGHTFKIYAGGEFNASIINGDADIWIENPGQGYEHVGDYKIKNTFRMGLGIAFGSEYLIDDKLGLNVGVKLVNLNMFLKNASGSNDDKEFQLRDDDNAGLNFAGNKNFSFYTIMAGVNFYFGIGEKRYKIK
jgi:hypothetical protein